MAPLSSTSAPTSSRAPSGPTVKSSQSGFQDNSYFSSPPSSTIPVTTPVATASSSIHPPLDSCHTQRKTGNTSLSDHTDMLQRLAAYLPPPPTLSLSSLRHSTQEGPSPHISTSHRASGARHSYEDIPSPMDRSRRSPPPAHSPTMDISTSPHQHTFHVQLPPTIQPEMITVSANKGDKLKVVADAWHMENDCHYEWQISFPPHDIDMTSIHAKFEENGHLTIDIRRLVRHSFGC